MLFQNCQILWQIIGEKIKTISVRFDFIVHIKIKSYIPGTHRASISGHQHSGKYQGS